MQHKLTESYINDLSPSNRYFEVWDTDLKGFLLRVNPSGVKTYYLFYRIVGKKRYYRIGRHGSLKPAEAREIARKQIGLVANGVDVQEERKAAEKAAEAAKYSTLKGFLDGQYEPWVTAHRQTGDQTLKRVRAQFKHLLDRSMDKITRWDIEKWREKQIKKGKKRSTINRDVIALRAVLSKAVEWDILEIHPLNKLKPLQTDKSANVRYLTEDEEKRLREALKDRAQGIREARDRSNEWHRERGYKLRPDLSGITYPDALEPMVLLSLNTGLRRGEIFNLKWKDVNLSSKILTVGGDTAKSGQTRHIPLNHEAASVLRTWKIQTKHKEFVFPGTSGGKLDSVRKSWGNILKTANVQNFRWHDLRHHFASRLVTEGVPLNTVRELLGHQDISTTLRYAHLAPDHKADAVAALDGPKT